MFNTGQKYYFQPSFIELFVLSIFEWPFYTGFTVYVGIDNKQQWMIW